MTARQNGIGVFAMRRLNANSDSRPTFSISGSNLGVANAHHGIFNTPLSKTVTIDHLQVRIPFGMGQQKSRGLEARGIPSPAPMRTGSPTSYRHGHMLPSSSAAVDETGDFTDELGRLLSDLEHTVMGGFAGDEIKVSLPIDASNVTGVVIRDLHYDLYGDGKLQLRIKCGKAILPGSVSEAVLRGCVAITGADGTELVSDCVRWDLERNHFTVPGRYILDCNGVLLRGRGVRCDHRLRVLGEHGTSSREGVGTWEKRVFR